MFVKAEIIVLALVGCALALAAARPSSGASPETRHVVRAGETLWAIADAQYAGDPRAAVWRIQVRNGLSGPEVAPGDVLYLPP
jgi:LysM repeat protein